MADNTAVPGSVELPKPPLPSGNGNKGKIAGVVEVVGESSLSREFLKPPKDFKTALAWTHINLNSKNIESTKKYFEILALHQWCTEFDDTEGIEELQDLLTGFPSVGGWNRSVAAQVESKIISPEALGVELDKNQVDALKKAQKERDERERENRRNNS